VEKLNIAVSGKISPQMNELLTKILAEKKITKSELIRNLLNEILIKNS
jgi:hypothetical protein